MRNPLVTLKVVRVNPTDQDEALDVDAMMGPAKDGAPLRQYIQTRDPECLKFQKDQNPVWFTVARLPAAFIADVLDGVFPLAARRMLAFRAAVHEVQLANGEHLKVHRKGTAPEGADFIGTDGDHGVTVAPVNFVQEVADRYGAETVQELGQVALDFARLPRGKRGPFTSWAGSAAGA